MEMVTQFSASGSQRFVAIQATFLSDTDRFALVWEKMRACKYKTKKGPLPAGKSYSNIREKKAIEIIKFRAMQLRYCNSCLRKRLPLKVHFKVYGVNSKL